MMNTVMGGGVPTAFGDPNDWTLVQQWDTVNGDLANIELGMSFNKINGFGWSLDGTKLTICNSQDDKIYMFTCSTPFDPDTANSTPTAVRAETNPSNMQFNASGSRLYAVGVVGDFIQAITCNNFVVGLATKESDVTKADVGFTGISDGSFMIPSSSEDYLLWEGEISTAKNIKKITLSPAGDLDGFTVAATESINPPISAVNLGDTGFTVISLDDTKFFRITGVDGVRLVTMATPADISTLTYGSIVELKISLSLSFDPVKIWIDPNDTTYVWIGAQEPVGEIQLAKLATNI